MTDARPPIDESSAHPSAEVVAAFLDAGLRGAEREAVVVHLADCAACRAEVVELRRALPEPRRAGRRTWPLAIAALAAGAAFAVVPSLALLGRSDASLGSATRAGETNDSVDTEPAVAVVAPDDDAVVDGPTPRLVWRSTGAGTMYRVTVQDTTGAVVWSGTVGDTSLAVAARPALRSGHRYYWSVDARLADGHAITTGVQSFTVR